MTFRTTQEMIDATAAMRRAKTTTLEWIADRLSDEIESPIAAEDLTLIVELPNGVQFSVETTGAIREIGS